MDALETIGLKNKTRAMLISILLDNYIIVVYNIIEDKKGDVYHGSKLGLL